MRPYSVWKCNTCGHLLAHDLIEPEKPERCSRPYGRGQKDIRELIPCTGTYADINLEADDEAPWGEGEREQREGTALKWENTAGGTTGYKPKTRAN